MGRVTLSQFDGREKYGNFKLDFMKIMVKERFGLFLKIRYMRIMELFCEVKQPCHSFTKLLHFLQVQPRRK